MTTVPTTASEIRSFAGQIGIFWPFAGSNDQPFQLRPEVAHRDGWRDWFANQVLPKYDAGYRLFCFHRPHGEKPGPDGKVMELDSYFELGRSPIPPEVQSSPFRLRDEISRAEDTMPGAVFVHYFGSHGPTLEAALLNHYFTSHFERLCASVWNLIEWPNVCFAFDWSAGVRWPETHPFARFIQLVDSYKRRQGLPTFVESIPELGAHWQNNMPAISRSVAIDNVRPHGRHRTATPFHDTIDFWQPHSTDRLVTHPLDHVASRIRRVRTVPMLDGGFLDKSTIAGIKHDDLVRRAIAAGPDHEPPMPEWGRYVKASNAPKLAAGGPGVTREPAGGQA